MEMIKEASYRKELEAYRKKVLEKIRGLLPVFAKASIGNFSADVKIPDRVDEFTGLYVGVQVMLEVIREKIGEFERVNSELKKTVSDLHREIEERKRTQEKLAESRERLDNFMNSATDYFSLFDENFALIDMNKAGYQAMGLKDKRSLIGKHILELSPHIRDSGRYEMYRAVIRTGTPSISEDFLVHSKTGERYFRSTAFRVAGGLGIISRDITLQKKYEERLENLARLSSESPNPILRFSLEENKLLYTNRAGEKLRALFCNPRTKSIRKEWLDHFRQINRKGKIDKHELEVDGSIFMCTLVPIGQKKYLNLYGDDITAVRQAEAELRKLSVVIAKTDNAVVVTDPNGRIEWVNEGFERLSGYQLEEVKGTRGEMLRQGKKTGLDPGTPFFRKMIADKQSVSYESRNYKKDGTEYWIFSTLTPVLNERGEVQSIVVVESDITLKKKAEQEMVQARRIAEESAKAKEQFLANMSHEIRTPMNAIMGIVQLMQDMELNEKQREYLRTMNFAGENLLYIINDVLDLSKIESGKMPIERIEFNLPELVNQLINQVRYRAKEKKIELKYEIQPGVPPSVIGDPVRLNQVLLNLLSNAIKFTDKGHVSLTIQKTGQKSKMVKLRFDVEDTGIGIPKEMRDQVFREFEQAHKGTARKYGGTGLGLAIVKRLVELQKGVVFLKSEAGQGSVFSVVLPFMIGDGTKKKKGRKPAGVIESEHIKGKRALLVEDNVLNQMVAQKFLEGFGLNVCLADNGMQAIEILKKENFDLVLMDIQMPEMDGYAATRFIREKMSDVKKRVPILAMTAHAIHGEEEKCLKAGMNDYISKPLSRDVLRDKVVRLLNAKKGTS
jgi:PAS domain S-box-containing protein